MPLSNPADLSLIALEATVDALAATVNAIDTLTETGGTITTTGLEQDVYINNAPPGVYRPVRFVLDFTNHTAGETLVVRTYYRIESGGALICQDEATYAGVQDPLLLNVDLDANRYGCSVTVEKTVGTNRAYDWEVFYEI